MNQRAIKAQLAKALGHLDPRELENLIDYYLDAYQQKILAGELSQVQLTEDIIALKKEVPVQYVTGISFFYGHRFFVEPGCLIPRQETEELVHWVIEESKTKASFKILDIGIGSGCILLSIMSAMSKFMEVEGWGIDVSEAALRVVKKNTKKMKLEARTILADIDQDNEWPNQLDCIVSNPPYILDSEKSRMDISVLTYEPEVALFVPDSDPLHYYKRIMHLGLSLLKPNGVIYFETSDLYHSELESAIDKEQYSATFKKDINGKWRMLKLTKLQLS